MREPMGAGTEGQGVVRAVAGVAGATVTGLGLWAFFGAPSFAEFAKFPPYNAHLIHDLGAFLIGLGATLLLALAFADGLLVALGGSTAGAVMHGISHVMDRDLGGRASDPWVYGLLAVVLGVAAWARYRAVS